MGVFSGVGPVSDHFMFPIFNEKSKMSQNTKWTLRCDIFLFVCFVAVFKVKNKV